MSKSIVTAAAVIAMTVLFGYLGAAMLEAETGRKILTAIVATLALVAVAEVGHLVLDRWRRRAA